jgi:hypothetical protein
MKEGENFRQEYLKKKGTVKPVYNGHPWDPKKAAVVQSWPVFTGFSIKIGIKVAWPDLGWPLLTGGR